MKATTKTRINAGSLLGGLALAAITAPGVGVAACVGGVLAFLCGVGTLDSALDTVPDAAVSGPGAGERGARADPAPRRESADVGLGAWRMVHHSMQHIGPD